MPRLTVFLTTLAAIILTAILTAPAQAADPPTIDSVSPAEVYNYQPNVITITGQNFAAGAAVTANDQSLSDVTLVDSTTLTATVPAGLLSGSYAITVTNQDDQSGSLPDALTVLQSYDGSLSPWQETTSLNDALSDLAAVTANGYVYSVGGIGPWVGTYGTLYSKILDGDELGTWQETSTLVTPRRYLAAVTANGYVYAIGGWDGNNRLSSVERAEIQSDGSLGAWQDTSTLVTSRHYHAAVTANGYVYAIGGYDGSSALSSVERAEIQSDGSLGAWQETSTLITERSSLAAVTANGYVYAIGGYDGSSALSSVERAEIQSDGSLGAWQDTSALITERIGLAAVTANGYVYAIGTSGIVQNPINEKAELRLNGTLGPWEEARSLITDRYHHGAVTVNRNIYVIGGVGRLSYNSYRTTNSVEMASISIPILDDVTPPLISAIQPTTITVSGTNFLPTPALQVGDIVLPAGWFGTRSILHPDFDQC